MSSTSTRQGLSNSLRSFKSRLIASISLLLLVTVLGAGAFIVSADQNTAPAAETATTQSGYVATAFNNILSLFGLAAQETSGAQPEAAPTPPRQRDVTASEDSRGSAPIISPEGPAACIAPPNDKAVWYTWNESGLLLTRDYAGFPHSDAGGTPLGLPAGKVGLGASFNGTTEYKEVNPVTPELQVGNGAGITVEAWIDPDILSAAPIVEWGDGANFGVHMWHSFPAGGDLFVNLHDTLGFNHTFWVPNVITGATFQHVAFTYDSASGNVRIFLDGVPQNLTLGAGTAATGDPTIGNVGAIIPDTSLPFNVGRRPSGGGTFYDGIIDELGVYGRALSAAEIAAIDAADTDGQCLNSIGLATGATTVVEQDGEHVVNYTINRTGNIAQAASIMISSADGTAIGDAGSGCGVGNDYRSIPANSIVNFGPGDASAVFGVTICGDTVPEPTEMFTVNLSNPQGANTGLSAGATGTGNTAFPETITTNTTTIEDDDTDVSVAVSPPSVTEDGVGNLNYTFTRSPTAGAGAITVNFTIGTGGVNATAGTDYTCAFGAGASAASCVGAAGTVTFLAGSLTAVVIVDPTADTVVEPDETVIFTVAAGTGYNVGAPSSATGTILNDDTDITLTGPVPTTSIESSGVAMVFTVTRTGTSGITANPLTVNFTTAGTASTTLDYTVTGTGVTYAAGVGSVIIPGGSLSATISVTPIPDNLVEGNETVDLSLANGAGYNNPGPQTATGTIIDDDATVSVAVAPASVLEDNGVPLVYTFTRTGGDQTQPITVNFTVGGSACFQAPCPVPADNPDYTQTGAATYSNTAGTVTIPAGAANVNITPIIDLVVEGDETVILTVVAGTNYVPAGAPNNSATGTITDDDSSIRFGSATQKTGENTGNPGNVVNIQVIRDGATIYPVNANATVFAGTAVGGAACTPGVDYIDPGIVNVIFPAGVSVQNIPITICDDNVFEGPVGETFTVQLSGPTGPGATLGTPSVTTVTINDNDAQPTFAVNNVSQAEGNVGTSVMTFTVTKTNATAFSHTISFATSDGPAAAATGGATCTGAVDYISTSGSLTFLASETTKTINVTICGDITVEPDENFTITLSTVDPNVGALTSGIGTILNDDNTVVFSQASDKVSENVGTATFTIQRGAGSNVNTAFTVDVATFSGTAVGGASCAAGIDFIHAGVTLNFTSGTASLPFNVTICNDGVFELPEAFTASLSNAVGAVTVGTPGTQTMNINDNDTAPTFAVNPGKVTITEPDSGTVPMTFTIVKSGSTAVNAVVSYGTSNGTATGGVACSATVDFINTSGSVTFLPGETSKTVNVSICGDTLFEPNENFNFNLTGVTNGTAAGNGVGNILNNDTAPVYSIDDVTQLEGTTPAPNTPFVFTVTRTGNAQAAETISFMTADGGGPFPAVAPGDYTAIPGDTVTFNQGETTKLIVVIVVSDTIFENDETFQVILTGASNGGTFSKSIGLGTILNDDNPPVFNINSVKVTEGTPGDANPPTTAVFTVTKSFTAPTTGTELPSIVSFNTTDGEAPTLPATGFRAAVAPGDYTAQNTTVSFAPGDLTKFINVNVVKDSIFELTEVFHVHMFNVTNGVFGPMIDGNGVINDDELAPNFTIAANVKGPENVTPMVFTINRSFPVGTSGTEVNSTVRCTTADISGNTTIHAQAGSDYTARGNVVGSNIVFTPADSSLPCNVTILNDNFFEGPETFNVNLAAITNVNSIITAQRIGTINDDDPLSLSINDVSDTEGNFGLKNFTFTITKTGTTNNNTVVTYFTTDGTATAPSDYIALAPAQLVFTPAETTKTVNVQVVGDLLVEPDETFTVNLANAFNNGVPVPITKAIGVGTIINDDGVPVSISGNISNFSPAGPLAGVTVTLSGSANAVTVTDANGNYSFTGLASGGNYLITPSGLGRIYSPTSRSYSNVVANITNANFVAYTAGNVPRTLTVQNGYTAPGSKATVPIVLTAQGDEAALSFSLSYNSAILSSPVVTCGVDSGALCTLVANTGTPGQIGVSVEPAGGGTWAAGTRIVVNVVFQTAATGASNTPVNFTDVPGLRQTSDSSGNPLPTVYNNGFVVFAQGFESDVASQFTGDGALLANDVTIVRQMVVGNIVPNPNFNEFQRADAAPAATFGDGLLASSDVVQARINVTQQNFVPAAGPFASIVRPAPEGDRGDRSPEVTGRTIKVVKSGGAPGGNVVVPIALVSQGDEVAASFTVNFDPAVLTYVSAALGSGVPPGTALTQNTNQVAMGRLGVLVDSGNSFAVSPPDRVMVNVTFTINPAAAPNSQSTVSFGNTPTPQSVSDPQGNLLTTAYESGLVNIMGPTSAEVVVSGRVLTPNGQGLRNATVTITDANGNVSTATTSTFGRYQFNTVEAGETYILRVSSKSFRFTPRVLQVLDSVADIDFIGEQ